MDAERSIRLIMTTLAQHRRQEAVLERSRPPSRGRLIPATSAWSVQIRRQATLVRITSIIESYVTEQLVQRFELHAPPPLPDILKDVYVRAENDAIASWPRMTEHYKRWFKIKISRQTCPAWGRVEALTDARNAVSHGLGELTRRMARSNLDQLRQDLATIDVAMAGNALELTESSLRQAASAGREFIEWLDDELERYDTKS